MQVYKREGRVGYVQTDTHVGTFEIQGAITRTSSITSGSPFAGTTDKPYRIGSYEIIPRGNTNNMPMEIRELLEENHIAPGILRKQFFLLNGQGPALFKTEIKDGVKVKTYLGDENTEAKKIQAWLDSWEHEEYLERCIIDYYATQGYFTEYIRNVGGRLGSARINRLEHVGTQKACLEWPNSQEEIKHIIVGPWDTPNLKKFRKYPKFDKATALKYPRTIAYNHLYSFAREYYSLPGYQGAINWIKRSSDIPKILESLTNNSLNIKWHIISPFSYWEKIEQDLNTQCTLKGVEYDPDMLEKVRKGMMSNLGEMLSGVENVGKFFHSSAVMNEYGKLEGWQILPIDQKVKDYITAQLDISKHSDYTVATGLGLAPSLSNLVTDGNLSSGSDKLYSHKLHLSTDTHVPERIICKAINDAIQINFPGTKIKLGFYREIVKTEESITPEKRTKNAV